VYFNRLMHSTEVKFELAVPRFNKSMTQVFLTDILFQNFKFSFFQNVVHFPSSKKVKIILVSTFPTNVCKIDKTVKC
jgi:hypothetical protein